MPCFARHERSAADLADRVPPLAVVDALDLLLAELLEDPPHAAKTRLQQSVSARPPSGALRCVVVGR